MRIAYLTGTYPRATDTFIQREVAGLRARGVKVETFAVRRPGDEQIVGTEQASARAETTYLLPPNWRLLWSHLWLLFAAPRRYIQGIRLAFQTSQPGLRGGLFQLIYFLEAGLLAYHLRQRHLEHLHNHLGDSSCTVAMLAATLGGFTYSFTLHGPYIFYQPYRWQLGEKIQRALFVACISYFCRSQGLYFAPLSAWPKLTIVHCGVQPQQFQMANHQGTGKHLICVGRLSAAKGFPIVIESLRSIKTIIPDVKLTLVGDGEDRLALEHLVAQWGLSEQVIFVGYQSQQAVRELVQQSDVFVLPSFAEGVPVSLMEAMAAGVPVVSSRIAGISELVDDGQSGYLVPPGDVNALAEKVIHLLLHPEARATLGQTGRAKVERDFNLDREVDWLHQVLTDRLAGQPVGLRPEMPSLEGQVLREV